MIFGTSGSGDFLQYRWTGALLNAFATEDLHSTPTQFLTTRQLWLGLVAAAAFLFAAIRLRRAREPI
jgi:hypothetical protein